MEEARRVIERLERIDDLRRGGAPADVLLDEVRGLLRDGERWLAAERPGGDQAAPVEHDLARASRALALSRRAVGDERAPEGVVAGTPN
jgi:hypothetical protein